MGQVRVAAEQAGGDAVNARAFEPDRIERAMDAITSDVRECDELADKLMDYWNEDLRELLTGANGYGDQATRRFRDILQKCERSLADRAERNLQTRGY